MLLVCFQLNAQRPSKEDKDNKESSKEASKAKTYKDIITKDAITWSQSSL